MPFQNCLEDGLPDPTQHYNIDYGLWLAKLSQYDQSSSYELNGDCTNDLYMVNFDLHNKDHGKEATEQYDRPE